MSQQRTTENTEGRSRRRKEAQSTPQSSPLIPEASPTYPEAARNHPEARRTHSEDPDPSQNMESPTPKRSRIPENPERLSESKQRLHRSTQRLVSSTRDENVAGLEIISHPATSSHHLDDQFPSHREVGTVPTTTPIAGASTTQSTDAQDLDEVVSELEDSESSDESEDNVPTTIFELESSASNYAPYRVFVEWVTKSRMSYQHSLPGPLIEDNDCLSDPNALTFFSPFARLKDSDLDDLFRGEPTPVLHLKLKATFAELLLQCVPLVCEVMEASFSWSSQRDTNLAPYFPPPCEDFLEKRGRSWTDTCAQQRQYRNESDFLNSFGIRGLFDDIQRFNQVSQ